jgi:hypothetical protein
MKRQVAFFCMILVLFPLDGRSKKLQFSTPNSSRNGVQRTGFPRVVGPLTARRTAVLLPSLRDDMLSEQVQAIAMQRIEEQFQRDMDAFANAIS